MLWDVTSSAKVFQIRVEQMRHYLYLIIDIATIFVPFFFSFHPRIKFHKKLKAFFPAMVVSGCAYLSWDIYFTVQGIWGFNPDYLMALSIWHLPIEEVLFFVCIPFACVFSHYTLIAISPQGGLSRGMTNLISAFLALILILMVALFFDKTYTAFNAFFTLTILVVTFVSKPILLRRFYIAWGLLMLPFLMVNGVLTGSLINAPIVWYNNAENLGIRIFTIPVEDVFYGMGLVLLNILLTEIFLPKDLKYRARYS